MSKPNNNFSQLFSPSEIYHENSKMRHRDFEFFAWVNYINTSQEVRKVISKPNYQYHGYSKVQLNNELGIEDDKRNSYDVFRRRRSHREFSDSPMNLNELSRLLFLADGVTCDMSFPDETNWKMRTAPSPGGLFPVEIYCVVQNVEGIESGLYLYSPIENVIIEIYKDTRSNLYDSLLLGMKPMAPALQNSAITIILAANMPKINFKYKERAYRFALLETGHIAQNILLGAELEELGAICVGGFVDDEINELIGADGLNKIVHYCIPVGRKL